MVKAIDTISKLNRNTAYVCTFISMVLFIIMINNQELYLGTIALFIGIILFNNLAISNITAYLFKLSDDQHKAIKQEVIELKDPNKKFKKV